MSPPATDRGTLAQRISGPALVSWPVTCLVIVWSVILAVFGSGGTAQGPLLARGSFAALGGAAACLVVVACWWGGIRHLQGGWRLATALAAVVVAGIVRGATVQLLLVALGYASPTATAAGTRMATSAVTISLAFLFGAAAWGSVLSYRETAAQLLAEQRRLAALVEASASGMEQQQAEAVDRVRRQLDDAVRALPLTSGQEAVEALGSLASDVVRPLSHSLARDLPPAEPAIPDAPPRVTLGDILRNPEPSVALRPVIFGCLLVVLGLPAAVLIYSPRTGLLIVCVASAITVAILSAGRYWLHRSPPQTSGSTWRRIIGVLLVAGIAASATVSLLDRADPAAGAIGLPALFAIIVFGALVAVASMLSERMRAITDDLAAVTVDMRWQLARVRTQQWEQRGRISRALHGPVQSLLHAQLMRLRRGLDDGSFDEGALEELRDQLKAALIGALSPATTAVSVSEVLDDVTATWQGVATVSHTIAPETERALAQDPLCSVALADLASEAISNSVRHGRATAVSVDVQPAGKGLLRLHVIDDGAVPTGALPGFGTVLLTECAIEWSLSTEPPTTLTALLPVLTS